MRSAHCSDIHRRRYVDGHCVAIQRSRLVFGLLVCMCCERVFSEWLKRRGVHSRSAGVCAAVCVYV